MSEAKKSQTKPVEPVEAVVVDQPVEKTVMHRRRMTIGTIFWGFSFIFIGTLLLLDNLGVITIHLGHLWQLWPVFIIGAGISMLSLRGWFAGIVSVILVLALGTLTWLVVVDNPYYMPFTSGSQQVSTVSGDSSSGMKSFDVTIKTGAVELMLNSSESQDAYSAELTSDNLSLNQSDSTVKDGVQYVSLTTEPTSSWWRGPGNSSLRFDVTQHLPLSLHVETGASTVSGDLSGAMLQSFSLKAGASTTDLKFGANFAKQDISLEAGASKVTLNLPTTAGIRVETENGLSSTDFEGINKVSDGVYESSGFNSAEKQITVHAKVGVSSFTIKRF